MTEVKYAKCVKYLVYNCVVAAISGDRIYPR